MALCEREWCGEKTAHRHTFKAHTYMLGRAGKHAGRGESVTQPNESIFSLTGALKCLACFRDPAQIQKSETSMYATKFSVAMTN